MNTITFSSLLLFAWLLVYPVWGSPGSQQRATPSPAVVVAIHAPQAGEALQGMVTVTGSTQVDGFQSAELSFGYQSDTTNTWFLLDRSSSATSEGQLALWDTTTISDGVYRLHLQVFLKNGQIIETTLDGLRVRNYLAIETSTPIAATALVAEVRATPTPTSLPDFQPVEHAPLVQPTNPAGLTTMDLRASLMKGMAVVAAVLLIAGLYLGIKAVFRR